MRHVHEQLVAKRTFPAEHHPLQRKGWRQSAERTQVSQQHRAPLFQDSPASINLSVSTLFMGFPITTPGLLKIVGSRRTMSFRYFALPSDRLPFFVMYLGASLL